MYDYLIVGAGLFGAVFANEAKKKKKKVCVIEKRSHIAGNLYTEEVEGINVHRYGAHIFHTSDKTIWDYVQQFSKFNGFINSPLAKYKNEVYNLPFNMNTFYQMWGTITPAEAKEKLEQQIREARIQEPKNLEEQALSLVGRDIYEKLIKGYTEKQWGKPAKELPAAIIKRVPVRMLYNNNYFDDTYQGIPIGGYTKMIAKMLEGIEVRLDTDFFAERTEFENIAKKIVFTGMIDEYFDYCYGELEYRSLRFETEILDRKNYQGNAVINYTEYEIPYTRIIEHKHFEYDCQKNVNNSKTVITREYPSKWEKGCEAYYPVNDGKNNMLYQKYRALAKDTDKMIFGGRLGTYQYMDMDKVVEEALILSERELN